MHDIRRGVKEMKSSVSVREQYRSLSRIEQDDALRVCRGKAIVKGGRAVLIERSKETAGVSDPSETLHAVVPRETVPSTWEEVR